MQGRGPRRAYGGAGAPGRRPTRPAPRSTPRRGGRRSCSRSRRAGGLDDVAAVSGRGPAARLVCLDESGRLSARRCSGTTPDRRDRPTELVDELGGPAAGSARGPTGSSVPVASLTVSKLRWLAAHEPQHAARVGGDRAPPRLADLAPAREPRADGAGDRPVRRLRHRLLVGGGHRRLADRGLLDLAKRVGEPRSRDDVVLPRVLGPSEPAAGTATRLAGGGAGRRGSRVRRQRRGRPRPRTRSPGQAMVSIGTSGVVAAVALRRPTARRLRSVAGFADATGHHLPLACTLNAHPGARRGGDPARCGPREGLAALALGAPSGAGGLKPCPTSPASARRTCPNATGLPPRDHAGQPDPDPPGPRLRRRGAPASLAEAMEATRAAGVADRAGLAGRRRRPLGGREGPWPRPCCGVPVEPAGARENTSPTAPPARPPGPSPAAPSPRAGAVGRSGACSRPRPTPEVMERYAEAAAYGRRPSSTAESCAGLTPLRMLHARCGF